MKRSFILFLLLGCTVLAPAQGQNLLDNGDFDRDLRDWTLEEFGIATFSPETDALDRAGSGAVELRIGELPVGLEGAIFSVCLSVSGSTPFFAGAAVQGDANASIRLEPYADPECGIPLAPFQEASLTVDSESFEFLRIDSLIPPPDTTHLKIELRTPSPQIGVARNLFDKVFVRSGVPGEFPALSADASVTTQGLQARFVAAASGGFSPFEPRFSWSFGDGAGFTGPEVEHLYSQGGEYSVDLVADNGYETDSSQLLLVVSEGEAPSIPTLRPFGLVLLLMLLGIGGCRRLSRT